MKRSVLAILAIALALLAQHYLAERISVVDAILLYAVAAYLTVRAFAGTEAIEEPASASASIETGWTQRTWGAFGIACLLLVLSLIWLRSPAPPFFRYPFVASQPGVVCSGLHQPARYRNC
ncbi:MAG: hypothetical protein E3J21_27150 [Anaerolineales bacterium]|nr:MAG: hypothetical protein E3J21_27150 [Anaerolineales bacterium]